MSNSMQSTGRQHSVQAAHTARRAMVLAAVSCRGAIEVGAGQPEALDIYHRLLEWLTHSDLRREVEPEEEGVLRTALGLLGEQDQFRATWVIEGAAVLAWALGEYTLPPHDQKVDPYEVADAVWFFSDEIEAVVQESGLRKREELDALRELMYAIHARLREFLRHRVRKDFTGWVEATWLETLGVDAGALIAEGDLAIDGRPLDQAAEERVQECSWIAFERHRAIIWLVENQPSYSQTPVDT